MESIYIKEAYRLKNTEATKKRQSFSLRIIFILFILQAACSYSQFSVLRLASYLDEAVSLSLLLIFLVKSIYGFRLHPNERLIILLCALLASFGFLSNMISNLQPAFYAFVDAFTCFKFLFAYLGTRALFEGKVSSSFVTDNLSGISKFFAVLFFLLTVHDSIFTPFFPLNEYRYFAYSIQLFYVHPQYLAFACILCVCVLTSTLERHRGNIVYILMLSFVIVRTLRIKSIGFVAVLFLLYIMVFIFQMRSQIVMLFLLLSCALLVGWDQIQNYFFNGDQARAMMTWDSIKIANRYFPFGSGFATFGSYMAAAHYSPLYQEYGYGAIYGMSEQSINYLMDTFWPTIIAQFGYIGTILFSGIIVVLLRISSKMESVNIGDFTALFSILCYMMISSTSESSFFNPFATILFILFALLVCENSSVAFIKETDAATTTYQSKYIKLKGQG